MPKQNLLSLLASAFVGLSSLVHEASASPIPPSEYFSKPPITDIFDFDKVFREINKPRFNPRDGVLLTYEEWKACEEAPQYPKTKEEIKQAIKADIARRYKVIQILSDGEKAFSYLTPDEKTLYKCEFNLFEPDLDIILFNKKYNLRFSIQDFQNNQGAKLLWFLDRHHSWRYSEEKAKLKLEKKVP